MNNYQANFTFKLPPLDWTKWMMSCHPIYRCWDPPIKAYTWKDIKKDWNWKEILYIAFWRR